MAKRQVFPLFPILIHTYFLCIVCIHTTFPHIPPILLLLLLKNIYYLFLYYLGGLLMKFICEKDELLKSIDIVSKAINPNNPIDILKGIKIDASSFIKFTGSDSDLSIESILEADVQEEGTLIVDSRIFYDIIKNLPDGKIKIHTSEKNELKITCSNTQFNILYLSSEGYPEVQKIEDGESIRIYSKNLKQIIKNTIFAVSDDESRPILTGTLFEISKSNMKAVSIDRFRLALRNQIIPETEFSELKFVVSAKVLNEISKILKDDNEIVDITIKNNSVMFKFDSFTIISRLLEGEFLDYNKFIPSQSNIQAKINVKAFNEMIERAAIIINYDDPKIPVVLKLKNSEVIVECISKFGNFCESIDIDKYGEDLKIGVDSKLILNALKCIGEEYAIFEFTNEQGPFVIKPVEGEGFVYMVLPMILKN